MYTAMLAHDMVLLLLWSVPFSSLFPSINFVGVERERVQGAEGR
jgi:hypothetical protein